MRLVRFYTLRDFTAWIFLHNARFSKIRFFSDFFPLFRGIYERLWQREDETREMKTHTWRKIKASRQAKISYFRISRAGQNTQDVQILGR
jgi:hypothetical protein